MVTQVTRKSMTITPSAMDIFEANFEIDWLKVNKRITPEEADTIWKMLTSGDDENATLAIQIIKQHQKQWRQEMNT